MSVSTSETMNIYEDLKHVPYLDSDVSYGTDISFMVHTNNNIQDVYSTLGSFNNAANTYLDSRTDGESLISDEFAGQFIAAHKSNVAMVNEMNKNSIEKSKQTANYLTYLKNIKGLTTAVTDLVDNSGSNLNDEYKNVEHNISKLKSELNNKRRHLEVNTYYEKKYKRQNEIAKNIVILLCFTLVGSFLFKSGIFNESFFIFYVAIMMAVIFLYGIYSVYDMYMRDDIDFDVYKYHSNRPSVGIRQNDKNTVDIPVDIKFDIPGYCKLKDRYLELQQSVSGTPDGTATSTSTSTATSTSEDTPDGTATSTSEGTSTSED